MSGPISSKQIFYLQNIKDVPLWIKDAEQYLQRHSNLEGAVASWLVRSSPDGEFRVLVGNTVLFSWARHFILAVSLSTQVYKWAPANFSWA